jgi:hypothetical protein
MRNALFVVQKYSQRSLFIYITEFLYIDTRRWNIAFSIAFLDLFIFQLRHWYQFKAIQIIESADDHKIDLTSLLHITKCISDSPTEKRENQNPIGSFRNAYIDVSLSQDLQRNSVALLHRTTFTMGLISKRPLGFSYYLSTSMTYRLCRTRRYFN